jgi:hypothetical protein
MAATTAVLNNLKTDLDGDLNPYVGATDAAASRRFVKNIDKILEIIKEVRVKASTAREFMIEPGKQSPPLSTMEADVENATTKTFDEYGALFFGHDAIPRNHDGTVQVNVPYDGRPGGRAVTMSNFYNQIVCGNPAIDDGFPGAVAVDNNFVDESPDDALRYYLDVKPGGRSSLSSASPFKRYDMLTWYYRTNSAHTINRVGHYVENSHSHESPLPIFNSDKVLTVSDNGSHPNPNSFEAQSLKAFFDYAVGAKIIEKGFRFSGWKFNGAEPIDATGTVPFRILPFCLQGCLVRTEQPLDLLYRPFSSYQDLWCKVYQSNNSALIPYDKRCIYLPDNFGMVERWDGMVLYVKTRQVASARGGVITVMDDIVPLPLGAVVFGGQTTPRLNFSGTVNPSSDLNVNAQIKMEARFWLETIYPQINTTRTKMFDYGNAARYSAYMYGAGPLRPRFGVNMVSHLMGLAMYVFNLFILGRHELRRRGLAGGYKKNIKNKYRNMTKKQRHSKSKSKSKSKSMSMFKSAKRAFYRTNKRNKTSRKY